MRGGAAKPATQTRCAIYTRKSSDEGLEQSFNSLDAQREACAAYILSQASEGWTALPAIYDDGGLSGGTLERPALKRLLADIAAGEIDIVVVYKVDRLTRSLLDFSRLVDAFDKADVSFVSITQSFNTTTSMGRLTLNMLLSFAQFEREVTAERIRDKIAASKAKGMWMGGTPPLGYQPNGRSLAIVDAHADLVRQIFARYLALGNVRRLQDELARERVCAPARTSINGKPVGGAPLSRGQLYYMLKNVIYTGQISHRGTLYPGQHPAIIDTDTFARVQDLLASHVQGCRSGARDETSSPLAGKIVDAVGEPLLAVHACKGRVRYRYYVSKALHHGHARQGLRTPAGEIEALVREQLRLLFADPLALAARAMLDVSGQSIEPLIERCAEVSADLGRPSSSILPQIIQEVRIKDASVDMTCAVAALAELVQCAALPYALETLSISVAARITRSGHTVRLVHDSGSGVRPLPHRPLVQLILRARSWWATLQAEQIGVTELAAREGISRSYLCRVLRLAFLSPAVVDAILKGLQRAEVDVAMLMPEGAIDASWRAQESALLPAA